MVYTDFISGINLEPFGDEENLSFNNYDFSLEGVYGLFVNISLANDDKPNNNIVDFFIGIDETPPTSTHNLNPNIPTGLNDWYVDPVEVTLTGDDGTELFQSGINHIEYKINDGNVQSIPPGDSFIISTDDEHTIDYWAVDNVGNQETPNTFDIKIDRTPPTIDLTWEPVGGFSKDILFTANCTDSMSGMDYVEFYKNDLYKSIDYEEPYEWVMIWVDSTDYTITAIAYDNAGLTASDSLEGEDAVAQSHQAIPYTMLPRLSQIRSGRFWLI